MKHLLLVFLFCISVHARAQHVFGVVVDDATKQKISGASVMCAGQTVQTDPSGKFSIPLQAEGNVLTIRHIGYKSAYYLVNTKSSDTIKISLQPLTVKIDGVTISGRNYKLDSIRTRQEFKSGFDYQGTRFKDIFISRQGNARNGNAPNSTASIVSLNLLNVFNLLSKDNSDKSRLKKRLLRGEEENLTDHRFSKAKVSAVTKLEGEALDTFMSKYRPDITKIRSMTEYELINYIKKCYEEENKKP